jgi:hypothetical protein
MSRFNEDERSIVFVGIFWRGGGWWNGKRRR